MKMMTLAVLLLLAVTAGGCALLGGEAPLPFITEEHPVLPAECNTDEMKPTPNPPRPKADLPGGASDKAALRDRSAWNSALTIEKSRRRACWKRLQELFPASAPKRGTPTS